MKILFLLLLLVILESFYSFYKKDDIYVWENTRANIFNQFIGFLKDIFIPSLGVIGIIAVVNTHLPHLFHIPSTTLTFLVGLVLMDFLYYLFHRTSHAFDFFWMFHSVHHGDSRFNLSTGFRSSWFEIILLFCFYSVMLLIGFPLPLFLAIFSFFSTYQFITHDRYLKLPKLFETIFVTPSYHMVHHGQDNKQHNSNFCGMFVFWDVIFSTQIKNITHFIPGLHGYHQNHFIKMHTDPIVEYFRKQFNSVK